MQTLIDKKGHLKYLASGNEYVIDADQLHAQNMEKIDITNIEWNLRPYQISFISNTHHGEFIFKVIAIFDGNTGSIESVDIDHPKGTTIDNNSIYFEIVPIP
ncbi:hypothetical protein N7613_14045 [Pseudomonas juntendi]|uniref:hypothetical protein n=1 Tax=Pseudomonas TaxID=286 RepID=UPI0018E6A5A1|nr:MULTISPECIES: hypothetical protein [Pseudomonas]MBI6916558.1 hypothetical protein [Pseudomonas juntendi]MDG9809751.1 hypothetical protein [Pseudomonas juntendi]